MKTGKGAVFFIAILLLVSTILASGCTDNGTGGGDSRTVKSGDTVQVDYTGKLEDGTVFDTSREDVAKQAGLYVEGKEYAPLTFTVGSGQLIPGFDEGVVGMKVGEEKTLEIPPEEAYGEYDEARVQVIPIEDLNLTNRSELPEAGQTYMDTYGRPFKVTAVNDTYITVDTNHELAGKTLIFDIKLVSIE
ncbi:FKBP-type peptidyl-prolyl cis-trans isomerase [Methanosarcina sp.]|uniref:FKBP-type peptidyl-prolyl cis-trans isomerase n=1 Tax=Methanosarcina sp. TaxID=2213 RepID=UPI003C758C29